LLELIADHKCACASSPVLLCAKGTNPRLRNRLSFNKRRWPLPQVRQGKMEGAFLRQGFPLVHAELCSGGSMAESLTRSHLIGRAWSMAEEWAAQGLACGADATAVELEVCELLGIYPPGAGTWELEHLNNRLPESFSLASSAPASTASPPRSTSSSTGKLAAPTRSGSASRRTFSGGVLGSKE